MAVSKEGKKVLISYFMMNHLWNYFLQNAVAEKCFQSQ